MSDFSQVKHRHEGWSGQTSVLRIDLHFRYRLRTPHQPAALELVVPSELSVRAFGEVLFVARRHAEPPGALVPHLLVPLSDEAMHLERFGSTLPEDGSMFEVGAAHAGNSAGVLTGQRRPKCAARTVHLVVLLADSAVHHEERLTI